MLNQHLSTVFDIGANLGNYTQLMLDKGAEKIIAVEANKDLATLLDIKFRGNNKITIIQKAVSYSNEPVNFYACDAHTISTANPEWIVNSRFAGEYNWYQPVKIDSVTIDELIEQYGIPDHIKIDVEGYELQVMLGLTKLVPSLISFEWAEESRDNIAKTLYYLKKLGYDNYAYTLNDDSIESFDGKFSPFILFAKSFLDSLDPIRKSHWGMVYVKP